jgi:hypothetical protein
MNQPIYHETSAATYFDNGDGSLTVKQKRKTRITQTIAVFKNDSEGHTAYRRFRKTLGNVSGRVYTLYRCPNDGRTYDKLVRDNRKITSGWISRRGNIPKKFAKVLVVLRSNQYDPLGGLE